MKLAEKQISIQALMDASGVRFGTSGVRGLVAEMTGEVCFAYTSAFLKAISATAGSVALAIDLRPSSPEIAAACAAAIEYAGLDVVFLGAIPTPALAYYAQTQNMPAIMVTGSHIPFDRNGIKFYGMAGEISKADEANINRALVTVPEYGLTITLPPVNRSAYQFYIDRYVQFFPSLCLAGMRLGFYEHSSVARDLLRELLERLGAQVISLGRTEEFVPIDTEAVSDADIKKASHWATQHAFDAILSTDGDADRPLVGDESGRWFRGDITGILCSQYLSAKSVVTTVSCNTVVERCAKFQNVVRTRIGSPYVIEGMERLLGDGAKRVVGFEPNGGFMVGSPIGQYGQELQPLLTRDAVLPILCMLVMSKERRCKVSELSLNLPTRFTASNRLQDFSNETSREILRHLATSENAIVEFLSGLTGKLHGIEQTDGLRIFLEHDEIVHLRPSGNAPELRCYAESASQERAEEIVQTCLQRFEAKRDLKLLI